MPDPQPCNSVSRAYKCIFKKRRLHISAILLFATASLMGGCGKKPGQVDAPPDVQDTFPSVYPDPSLDPPP